MIYFTKIMNSVKNKVSHMNMAMIVLDRVLRSFCRFQMSWIDIMHDINSTFAHQLAAGNLCAFTESIIRGSLQFS